MAEGFPRWAAEEIAGANWQYHETWKSSGFILEINPKERRIDVQFYERLPEGRYIATLDIPKEMHLDSLRTGEAYLFSMKVSRAQLSQKLIELLKERYQVAMDTIYRFELASFEPLAE